MRLRNWLKLLIIAGEFMAMPSYAQLPRGFNPQFFDQAGSVDMGGLQLYPSLQTTVGYDDNIYSTRDHQRSSTVSHLIPEFDLVYRRDSRGLALGYQADVVNYDTSSADNAIDQWLFLKGYTTFAYRHQIMLDIRSHQAHEERGSGLSEGFNPVTNFLLTEPDTLRDDSATIRYNYGAEGAPGGLRFSLSTLDRAYTDNRDRTRYYDRKDVAASAAFLWRVLPRTALALEGRHRSIHYLNDRAGVASLDSHEEALLVGGEWALTNLTSGEVRVGRKRKNFISTTRSDVDSAMWELSAKWTPLSYSRFDLSLQRSPRETQGTGDFIDDRTITLDWRYQWLDRVDSRMTLSRDKLAYHSVGRRDRLYSTHLEVNYAMRRWLTWQLAADWYRKNSDVQLLEYGRTQYWLTATINLQ